MSAAFRIQKSDLSIRPIRLKKPSVAPSLESANAAKRIKSTLTSPNERASPPPPPAKWPLNVQDRATLGVLHHVQQRVRIDSRERSWAAGVAKFFDNACVHAFSM
jgi:hypothetical protein